MATKRNKIFKFTVITLVCVMTVVCFNMTNSFASTDTITNRTDENFYLSCNNKYALNNSTQYEKSEEYIKIETDGPILNCEFKHSCEGIGVMRVLLYEASKSHISTNEKFRSSNIESEGELAAGALVKVDPIDVSNMEPGNYELVVKNNAMTSDAYEIFREIPVRISEDHKVYVASYSNVEANNKQRMADKYSSEFLDKGLADYSWVYENPSTGKTMAITDSMKTYYQKIATSITKGSTSDYDKMFEIYKYVASNFYYDTYAWQTKKNQYVNPYSNLVQVRNGGTSAGSYVNANDKKIATTCIGYASAVVALGRAVGIPVRMVEGYSALAGEGGWIKNTGAYVSDADIVKSNHYWAEAYVDGRWIAIDATKASLNLMQVVNGVKSWESDGDSCRLYLFDPTEQFFATTHYKLTNRGGIPNSFHSTLEKTQLASFLNYGTNGKKISTNYDGNKTSTWKIGSAFLLGYEGTPYGRVTQVNVPNKDLYGTLNLDNFSQLKYVFVYGNKLSKISLANCKNLLKISASPNTMTSIDLSGSKVLQNGNFSNSSLKSFTVYTNKRSVKFTSINGSFGVIFDSSKLSQRIKLNPKSDIGYKYYGLKNKTTNKTTKGAIYINPGSSDYSLSFVLNPYSYKYYLNVNCQTYSFKQAYIYALEKRLKSLGYFSGTPDYKYTTLTFSAVKSFQKKAKLNQTGTVREGTWKKLFSTSAPKK